ncbi:DUF1365 domain-containing protein [Pelagibius sp. Alg239-R121]|uniref:DUF1365 domain-containing protein n=1 Tax=Pelagibius sp. Alg239-R121 TaxID=2993448 RepID=UPI0024A6C48C|nr:DUF1365 domain-containing protein [Pelagibius sp. Alg239-R121]
MTSETIATCLYFGRVMHKRLRPFSHRFSYRTFAMLIDLEELPLLDRKLRFFSHNKPNVFSFFDKDHGQRDGTPPREWLDGQLAARGIDLEGGQVQVLCMPRMLGYVFNPLSIWFCRHRTGNLKAIVYEVRNTFGEHHTYVEAVDAKWQEGDALLQSCDKAFYVSPFIDMKARYNFRLKTPSKSLSVVIRQQIPEGELLIATQNGTRSRLTSLRLLSTLVRYPLMTFKVTGAIHWQALRLWLKGARLQPRPGKAAEAGSTANSIQNDREIPPDSARHTVTSAPASLAGE